MYVVRLAMPLFRSLIIAVLCCAPMALAPNSPQVLAAAAAPYGGCGAPSQAGVHVCAPLMYSTSTAIAAPFQVIAAGTGGGGPVRLMQLWADGKKITQVSGSLFDKAIKLPVGSHQLTVVELDTTGAYVKSKPINVDVQYDNSGIACATPSSPGVNVCEPAAGACHTSAWITFVATGTGASGSIARMELWANGTKLANFYSNKINTTLFLTDYTKVTIVAVDSKGAVTKSKVMTMLSC